MSRSSKSKSKSNNIWNIIIPTICGILGIILISLLWWGYDVSGNNIITLSGNITAIDTASLEDCNIFKKSNYKLIIHYDYTFENSTYIGEYELCLTNKEIKNQLKIRPIGSKIIIYIQPDNPNLSTVSKMDLMDQVILGLAITFTIGFLFMVIFYCCCCEIIKDIMIDIFKDKVKDSASNAIDSVV